MFNQGKDIRQFLCQEIVLIRSNDLNEVDGYAPEAIIRGKHANSSPGGWKSGAQNLLAVEVLTTTALLEQLSCHVATKSES